jgi:aminotransferase
MSNQTARAGERATSIRYRMMELASQMEDVISLGRGDPDLDTPQEILDLVPPRAEYSAPRSPVQGLPELRRAVTHRYAEEQLLDLDPERCCLITNGAQEALFLAMLALVDPGDRVATHDPRYSSYDQAVGAAGGTLITIPTLPEHDFRLQPEAVREHAEGTKLLVFVNPNNPTSAHVEPAGVKAIAEVAREMDMLVVYDEIYGDFVYDGVSFQSMAACPLMQEWTVTIGGFSKTYAMTGFRVGYLIGEPPFIQAATALKAAISGPCPKFSQQAALAAMDVRPDPRPRFREIYDSRRKRMMAGLDAMGARYSHPGGGLFVWADLSSFGMETEEFCYRLLEQTGVLVFPGASFGRQWRSWVRISLLAPDDRIDEALARMERFVGGLA